MAYKKVLSTWEAGRYCQTSPYTIRNWVNSGRLAAYTTPGGHRRIRRQDLDAFLLANHMPLPGDFEQGRRRLLVLAEQDRLREWRELEGWSEDLQVILSDSAFEAGLLLTITDPHLLVVDLDGSCWKGLAICRRIHGHPHTSHIKLAGITRESTVDRLQEAEEAGLLHCFSTPLDRGELYRFLRREFPSCRISSRGPA